MGITTHRKKKLPQLKDAEQHLLKCAEYANRGVNELKLSEFNDLLNRVFLAKDILVDKFNYLFPDRLTAKPKATANVEDIVDIYKTYYPTYIKKTRQKSIIRNRQTFCWFMRKKTNFTLQEIADIFNYDHSSILHSINVVEKELECENYSYKEIVDFVSLKLKEKQPQEENN